MLKRAMKILEENMAEHYNVWRGKAFQKHERNDGNPDHIHCKALGTRGQSRGTSAELQPLASRAEVVSTATCKGGQLHSCQNPGSLPHQFVKSCCFPEPLSDPHPVTSAPRTSRPSLKPRNLDQCLQGAAQMRQLTFIPIGWCPCCTLAKIFWILPHP